MGRWCDPPKKTQRHEIKGPKLWDGSFTFPISLSQSSPTTRSWSPFQAWKIQALKKSTCWCAILANHQMTPTNKKLCVYIKIVPKKKHIKSFIMKGPLKSRYVTVCAFFQDGIFNITKKLSFLRPLLNSSRLMRWSLFESNTWRFQRQVKAGVDMNTTPKMNMVSWKIDIFNIGNRSSKGVQCMFHCHLSFRRGNVSGKYRGKWQNLLLQE